MARKPCQDARVLECAKYLNILRWQLSGMNLPTGLATDYGDMNHHMKVIKSLVSKADLALLGKAKQP